MSDLSEEEIIKILKDFTENEDTIYCYDWQGFDCQTIIPAIQGLLNLYKIEKINNETNNNIIASLQKQLEKARSDIKSLNIENQALYESINCNDDNMLAREYQKLKEKYEKTFKELKERIADNLNYKILINRCIYKNRIKEIKEKADKDNCYQYKIFYDEVIKLLEEN